MHRYLRPAAAVALTALLATGCSTSAAGVYPETPELPTDPAPTGAPPSPTRPPSPTTPPTGDTTDPRATTGPEQPTPPPPTGPTSPAPVWTGTASPTAPPPAPKPDLPDGVTAYTTPPPPPDDDNGAQRGGPLSDPAEALQVSHTRMEKWRERLDGRYPSTVEFSRTPQDGFATTTLTMRYKATPDGYCMVFFPDDQPSQARVWVEPGGLQPDTVTDCPA